MAALGRVFLLISTLALFARVDWTPSDRERERGWRSRSDGGGWLQGQSSEVVFSDFVSWGEGVRGERTECSWSSGLQGVRFLGLGLRGLRGAIGQA